MYNINILKQELSISKTYEHNLLEEQSVVDRHRCNVDAKFSVFVDEDHSKLPTFYWLPKLHKRPYKNKSPFIANSSSYTTTDLSINLTYCLTAIKNHVKNIVKQFLRGMVKLYIGLLKTQVRFLTN